MGYMEIAMLPKGTLRIRDKNATFVIDPVEKEVQNPNGVLLLSRGFQSSDEEDDSVVINGPGDYEVAGIKIAGTKTDRDTAYSLKIDGVDVLIGQLHSLEKMQQKLKEHQIVIVLCNSTGSTSFLTSLASNVILFYGDTAQELIQTFGKGENKQMSKYITSLSKLPVEMETVLLA